MPKGRTDTWQTCPTPQTPLQRSAFLDLCVHWLVREPATEALTPLLSPCTTWSSSAAPSGIAASSMGLTRSDLRIEQYRGCAFCETAEGLRPVIANPFTQRPLSMACEACRANLTRKDA